MDDDIGFIILRHVNSEQTDCYWKESYQFIRRLYPENKIVIIDDNSQYEFVTALESSNVTIIQSEFPGKGEILPYYYFLKYKWFDKAVILHDSVFIKQFVDFRVDTYKMLWSFEHTWDSPVDEKWLMSHLNHCELLNMFYDQSSWWKGVFGAMSVIRWDFLHMLDERYDFSRLVAAMETRHHRMWFERIYGCIACSHGGVRSILGNIHQYCEWDLTWNDYLTGRMNHLPVVKVWTGR
jgi:hypothetical protein